MSPATTRLGAHYWKLALQAEGLDEAALRRRLDSQGDNLDAKARSGRHRNPPW